ncbi:phage major tail tube protein [uncultured Pseudacidovorax sp.]|uniref:phage major tail tube protein n=1 Tax=uncultured Pseudacidovorax sp. TaxID=679313 RepID=UPI0025CE979D|nr:phage major tail tube protein [uncultured Pseudacidovorax sp.]
MGMPKKLKNFALFGDGESWIGEIPSVTLPTVTKKMEEYRAGGMHGPVQLDMGHEKLELALKSGGLKPQLIAMLGANTVGATVFRFAGAYQDDATGQVTAAEVIVRGRVMEWNPNEAKAGDDNDHDFKIAVSYYKLTVDGAELLEIDVPGMVWKVGGSDVYSAIRFAIGLAPTL